MTGWDEARDWLASNAPDWKLLNSETRLFPGPRADAPTVTRSEVMLAPNTFYEAPVWVKGEGATILEAVQNAIGGLH
jgi:hypothetical protein